jgi:polygalacturonase
MLESIFRRQFMDETCQGVDVRQFGAKGDDVTDDAAAFQAAVDYLYLKDKPGRIVLAAKPSRERGRPQDR